MVANTTTMVGTYDSFMEGFDWSKRDTRVDEWPLMSSIYPTLIIATLYVVFAKIIGPKFMENREPYNIFMYVQTYNIVQVCGSIWIFQGVLRNGWLEYSQVCQPVDRNPNPNSTGYKMATFIYIGFLIRFLDMMDTLFFVLRKKWQNVNQLQVVHHFVTPIYFWLMVRYEPGGNDTIFSLLNSFIHTIMYSYYFLAAMGPKVQKYLWWKRYLTRLQILQFAIVFAKSGINIAGITDCGFSWQFSVVTLALMVLMFWLFGDFYINTYVRGKGTTKRAAVHENGVKTD